MVHACNPSYLGGRGKRIGLRPTQANLKSKTKKRGCGGAARALHLFSSQYHTQKRQIHLPYFMLLNLLVLLLMACGFSVIV
jgi:hypothetical protein